MWLMLWLVNFWDYSLRKHMLPFEITCHFSSVWLQEARVRPHEDAGGGEVA